MSVISLFGLIDSSDLLAFNGLLHSNLDYPDLDYPDFFSGPNFVMNIY